MCELGGTPISITMEPEAACEYTKERLTQLRECGGTSAGFLKETTFAKRRNLEGILSTLPRHALFGRHAAADGLRRVASAGRQKGANSI